MYFNCAQQPSACFPEQAVTPARSLEGGALKVVQAVTADPLVACAELLRAKYLHR